MIWFRPDLNRPAHALNHDRSNPPDGQFTGLCGFQWRGNPYTADVDDETFPVGACLSCMETIAMASVEEESLEDALARGFARYEPGGDD